MSNAQDVALLTKQDLPDIVQRYRNGESLSAIAPETTVTWRQLYNWMYQELGEKFYDLQTEVMISRHADACQMMETACDQLQLARAREVAKLTSWALAVRRPKLFAPKQEIRSDSQIQVFIQRDASQPVVVDVAKAEDVS